ncbi:MAG: sulfatase-like hydrolase/transferase [Planctomycetota bacterium]
MQSLLHVVHRLLAATAVLACALACHGEEAAPGGPAVRPNILWITCEDMSPDLGCWGCEQASTPHIDRLARQGVRYTSAFAQAPVCSPARSCLITGMYQPSCGLHQHRSRIALPGRVQGFPYYLQRLGYFCTNNAKTDYNVADQAGFIRQAWDRSDRKAHWRQRKPGQPFFSVFNFEITHQSRTAAWPYAQFETMIAEHLTPELRHDPARALLPPYYPDTPIMRRTVARYHDCIAALDRGFVGPLLDQLEEDGLADDTIVFFYSDHGAGMPRHKRLLHDSGLNVPLIVRFPERYRHMAPASPGGSVDRLVSFVDFAPTVLTLAGAEVPEYMQGQAFLPPDAAPPRHTHYGARDRVDEAFDMGRSVRDDRWLYIRNYMPHLSYHQPEHYSREEEIRLEISRLADAGQLNDVQMAYAGPRRAAEELYDVKADPCQIHNLAALPDHRQTLERMRAWHREHVLAVRDLGFLPEEDMNERFGDRPPMDAAADANLFPLERIFLAAEMVGRERSVPKLAALLEDSDPAVRYWGVIGLVQIEEASPALVAALERAAADTAPAVRIEAAAALVRLTRSPEGLGVLERDVLSERVDIAQRAARAIQLLGEAGRPLKAVLAKAAEPLSETGPDAQATYALRSAIGAAQEALDRGTCPPTGHQLD